jgi:hypothetical protein
MIPFVSLDRKFFIKSAGPYTADNAKWQLDVINNRRRYEHPDLYK